MATGFAQGRMRARPFNIMVKPIGPRCNIACSYCYYIEKDKLFPQEKSFRMSDDVLEAYTRQLIDASVAAGQREVTFAWQGGEPTMLGVDFYAKALAFQRRYAPAGISVTNVLQTNGMLLDDDWGRFLHDNRVLVGISIDGPKQVHDRYRNDRAGRPSFDAVMRGLDVLQRHGVAHNALTTVHRANGGKGREVYRFLKGVGIEHMQFIPIAERGGPDGLAAVPQVDINPGHTVTDWSVRPRAYGKFLCDVFDTWIKRDVGRIFVQHFDAMLGKWLGRPGGLCVFSETCGDGLVLEHDGSLYSCDHYVFPEFRLGRITDTPLDQMLWTDRQAAFGRDKRDSLTAQCRGCAFRAACNGGCPKHRFATSRSGEAGHNYFCESYTMFLQHAGPRLSDMARLVASGRSAAEVMT